VFQEVLVVVLVAAAGVARPLHRKRQRSGDRELVSDGLARLGTHITMKQFVD
jgi:hypothetical protein